MQQENKPQTIASTNCGLRLKHCDQKAWFTLHLNQPIPPAWQYGGAIDPTGARLTSVFQSVFETLYLKYQSIIKKFLFLKKNYRHV